MRFQGSKPCFLAMALGVLATPPLRAQDHRSAAADQAPVVAVVGASVSAGFADPRPRADGERNETVTLRHVLRALWREGRAEIRAREAAMLPMFLNPDDDGRQQLEHVLKEPPALVLALDFPFWFGYGARRGDAAARLAAQARGFELLDRLVATGAVVV